MLSYLPSMSKLKTLVVASSGDLGIGFDGGLWCGTLRLNMKLSSKFPFCLTISLSTDFSKTRECIRWSWRRRALENCAVASKRGWSQGCWNSVESFRTSNQSRKSLGWWYSFWVCERWKWSCDWFCPARGGEKGEGRWVWGCIIGRLSAFW